MTVGRKILAALASLGIVGAIAIAFALGLTATVYLSLRSPEVKVPEVVGKDRFVAEKDLEDAGLNFRVRATRPSNQVKSDTVMFQLPRAGDVVKEGQTVAVDVSRAAREGEASETVAPDEKANAAKANDNSKENSNGNTNAAKANDNKPKRNKNANTNGNGNSNTNRNANANRPNANARANANRSNANSAAAGTNNNNRGTPTENANRPPRNVNRPAPLPVPSPPDER